MPHAIRIHELGSPDVMSWDEVPVPSPGPGQARIRHTAIGVNFIDTYHRSGVYSLDELPATPGVEAAGVVEEVGDGVTEVEPGERIAYASTPPGAYAEQRIIEASKLVPLPDDIDDRTAAAAMVKGMTVEFLIRRTYRVREGDWVLLHAAAGGVGSIAVQWLESLGAHVIGTCGTDEKAALIRSLGCEYPVVYTREDFVERVREITDGRGVDVVYDSVGKATFRRGLKCLRSRGMLVAFGNASGRPDPIDPLELASNGSLYLTRPTLFDYTRTRQDLLESASDLFDALRNGAIEVPVRQEWPLKDAAAAHRALEARETVGSTVLVP